MNFIFGRYAILMCKITTETRYLATAWPISMMSQCVISLVHCVRSGLHKNVVIFSKITTDDLQYNIETDVAKLMEAIDPSAMLAAVKGAEHPP